MNYQVSDKKLNNNEIWFLIYFIPIFFAKLLNITAENDILKIVAIFSFAAIVLKTLVSGEKYSYKELAFWCVSGLFGIILMICSGKEGVLFTIITFFAMRGVSIKKVLPALLFAGVIAVLVSMYIERDGQTLIRYQNGSYVTIFKRSNILFISFFALVSLFCLYIKNKIGLIHVLLIFVLGFLMFLYTGSRTGLVCLVVLCLLLLLFKLNIIRNCKFIRLLCVLTPTLLFLAALFMSIYYDKLEFLDKINKALEGRLLLSNQFLDEYPIKLFGQKIFESTASDNFRVLDIAYIDMIISYGAVFSLLWCIFGGIIINKLIHKRRFVEVAIILAYGLYGLAETFLTNCFLNVSLLICGEFFVSLSEKKIINKPQMVRTKGNNECKFQS